MESSIVGSPPALLALVLRCGVTGVLMSIRAALWSWRTSGVFGDNAARSPPSGVSGILRLLIPDSCDWDEVACMNEQYMDLDRGFE